MTKVKTSLTDPIRVAWIESAVLSRQTLGVTFAPGKKDPYGHGGSWDRDLKTDLRELRQRHRADVLICLLEDHELALLHIEDLPAEAEAAGLEFVRFPIPDVTAPAHDETLQNTVKLAIERAQSRKRVVVHCRGGCGRAGTFAAYCLVALGEQPHHVIRFVRAVRPCAVETREQEQSIIDFPWRI